MMKYKREILPFLFAVLSFLTIILRLSFVQIWNHQDLARRVEKLVCRNRPEIPCRGQILDRNGRVLAMSMRSYALFADPTVIENPREVESSLNGLGIQFNPGIIEHARNTSFVPVADKLDLDKFREIKSLDIRGVGFLPEYNRMYPEGVLACHVLGFVGKDGLGLEGIEYITNSYLSGNNVKELSYRDGRGREISAQSQGPGREKGDDVYLTIDRNIQYIAEQEIDRAWRETGAKKAIVVIQDPNNGEILALACRPSFDNENFKGAYDELRNPAISNIFEPGSTFKLVTAAAALEEKVIKRNEVVWCENGKYAVYDHEISDHEKKGLLTFNEVLRYSSNIGMVKVGEKLGKERLYRYIRQFGFYTKSGIDLPGESKGLLKYPSKWSGLSLACISFGQEIGVTPLQILNAFSAIANGGELLVPKIIKEIRDTGGNVLYNPPKRVIRRAISVNVSAELKQILEDIVVNGTGQGAGVPGYSVGGKTGTAQKRDPLTKKYSSTAYVASFCGIIPMNKPRLTILVLLDEPKGVYWAASRAVPVFNRIALRCVRYLQIRPDKQIINLANLDKNKVR